MSVTAPCIHINTVALADKLARVQHLVTAIDMAAGDLDCGQREAIKAIAELAADQIREVIKGLS